MNKGERHKKLLLYGEESERLLFREITDADYDIWMEFCRDPASVQYIMADLMHKPQEACKKWFDRLTYRAKNKLGGMNALIEKETGAYVGHCGLLVQDVDGEEVTEVGYSLMPAQRGKGYASEASQKCRDHFFSNELGDFVVSTIDEGNDASVNVALRNGMKWYKKGKLLQVDYPINVYRITREEWLAGKVAS